jgi:hypothetical protein
VLIIVLALCNVYSFEMNILGTFFAEDSEKVAMCGFITSRVSSLLNTALIRSPQPQPGAGQGQGQGAWLKGEELRSVECLHFGSVILRLLGNFRLSIACRMHGNCFEVLFGALGGATFTLSEELAALAGIQLNKLFRSKGRDGAVINVTLDIPVVEGELSLLDGWRGGALDTLLDAWCMVLDDPIMIEDTSLISESLKHGLKDMAGRTFCQLQESIMRSTVHDVLAEMEEEEEENEDDYASVGVNLLKSVCTVGRTNFKISLHHVCRYVHAYVPECSFFFLIFTTQMFLVPMCICISFSSY